VNTLAAYLEEDDMVMLTVDHLIIPLADSDRIPVMHLAKQNKILLRNFQALKEDL
jgi:hypothetical protein